MLQGFRIVKIIPLQAFDTFSKVLPLRKAAYCEGFAIFAKTITLEIISPEAQSYAALHTSPEDTTLHSISSFAANHPQAGMLSGHVQGKFLEMVSMMIRPFRVLEIGSFLGYSAICLSKGLSENGLVHTLEFNKENAAAARANFKLAGNNRIILHEGNALELIPAFTEVWDLVFIDADKVNYSNYYKLVLPKVRPGGFILADNVLFHGEVFEKPFKGKAAAAIDEFNRLVNEDNTVEKVMLTIRDGLLLIRKK